MNHPVNKIMPKKPSIEVFSINQGSKIFEREIEEKRDNKQGCKQDSNIRISVMNRIVVPALSSPEEPEKNQGQNRDSSENRKEVPSDSIHDDGSDKRTDGDSGNRTPDKAIQESPFFIMKGKYDNVSPCRKDHKNHQTDDQPREVLVHGRSHKTHGDEPEKKNPCCAPVKVPNHML